MQKKFSIYGTRFTETEMDSLLWKKGKRQRLEEHKQSIARKITSEELASIGLVMGVIIMVAYFIVLIPSYIL